MVYIRGDMLHLSMAGLATVGKLCNIVSARFIQKPKARARRSGLIAVCPESLESLPNPSESQSRIPLQEILRFDPLRGEPRFQAVIRRMNLTP